MRRTFRYLLRGAWVNLGCLLGAAVAVAAGAALTGAPEGNDNLFSTYYAIFPLMALLVLYILSISLSMTGMDTALSLGGRRRDFFWGSQGILALYAAACWALQAVMTALPGRLGWSTARWNWGALDPGASLPWLYPLMCLAILALGVLAGLAARRSRWLGTGVMMAGILALMAAMIALMMVNALAPGEIVPKHLSRWVALGTAAVLLAGEGIFWRAVRRCTVR